MSDQTMDKAPLITSEIKLVVDKVNYPINWTPIGRYYYDIFAFRLARSVLTIPIAIAAIVVIVLENDIIPAFIIGIMALSLYIVGSYALQKAAPLMAIAINENNLELYSVENRSRNQFTLLEKLDFTSLVKINDKREIKRSPRIEFTFNIESEIYDKRHIFIPKEIFESYQEFFNDEIVRKIENQIPILMVHNQD